VPCQRQAYLQLLHLVLELHHFGVGLVRRSRAAALPLDVVLGLLLDQPNAFQHIGDVVDAPLLDLGMTGHSHKKKRITSVQPDESSL
jgi:hypothetical protein